MDNKITTISVKRETAKKLRIRKIETGAKDLDEVVDILIKIVEDKKK